MNKEEFLKTLEQLNLPRKEYIILSGGSLLLRGLREQTADLDITVSRKLAEELDLYHCPKDDHGIYTPFANVQMMDDMEQFRFDVIEGYQCESLEDILQHKLQWNRPKDQKDIEVIQVYMRAMTAGPGQRNMLENNITYSDLGFFYTFPVASEIDEAGYKAMRGLEEELFLPGVKLMHGTKPRIFYFPDGREKLPMVFRKMDPGRQLQLAQILVKRIIEIRDCAFLNLPDVAADPEWMFYDQDRGSIQLLYIPTSSGLYENETEFEQTFRKGLAALIESANAGGDISLMIFADELSDPDLELDYFKNYLSDGAEEPVGKTVPGKNTAPGGEAALRNMPAAMQNKAAASRTGDFLQKNKAAAPRAGTLLQKIGAEELKSTDRAGSSCCNPLLRLQPLDYVPAQPITITKTPFLIGRMVRSVDGVIKGNRLVGRIHCKIEKNSDGVTLTDLNSANGTRINGTRLEPGREYPIHAEDIISIADIDYKAESIFCSGTVLT